MRIVQGTKAAQSQAANAVGSVQLQSFAVMLSLFYFQFLSADSPDETPCKLTVTPVHVPDSHAYSMTLFLIVQVFSGSRYLGFWDSAHGVGHRACALCQLQLDQHHHHDDAQPSA